MKTKKERERMKEVRRFWKTKPPKLVITMFDSAHFIGLDFGTNLKVKLTNLIYLDIKLFLP